MSLLAISSANNARRIPLCQSARAQETGDLRLAFVRAVEKAPVIDGNARGRMVAV